MMLIRSFLFLCMLSLLTITTKAIVNYSNVSCSNNTTFIPNSAYHANLKLLLPYLSSNATKKGYYNATAGHNSTDKVYGNFLCRGDLTPEICHECVVAASKKITQKCLRGKVAVIWYDECMLRYSNNPFFSLIADKPLKEGVNHENVREPDLFMKLLLNHTMTKLVSKITSKNSKMFAIKEDNFVNKKLYTLAQCTPDLSVADCVKCLKIAVVHFQDCCSGKIGGRVLLPSCYVRYEPYQFYDLRIKGNFSSRKIVIAAIICGFMLLFTTVCFFKRIRAKKKNDDMEREIVQRDISYIESLLFDLDTIEAATNNFSEDNKLGEGGFGGVYKGILPNGQEIAAKRLSRSSGQGSGEFRNEIELVAKLQHRNLVRLLGLCFNGEEKILVYECVPNRSLDYFIFDAARKGQLDWSRRYKIIGGITRGILYLHEESRLRIVHRDLKASNVLLDEDMNPKISDFGMARILGVNQTQGNTCRIAGTYGYMSPEYVMCGQFSVKSDAFSFGVLILEIISGKKNSCSYQSDRGEGLLGYAWKFWTKGAPLEIMDPILKDNSYSTNEIIKCIHIALLCVQEDMEDRPTMASVILMLNGDSVNLPLPREPAFINLGWTWLHRRYTENICQPTSSLTQWSASEAPIAKSYSM